MDKVMEKLINDIGESGVKVIGAIFIILISAIVIKIIVAMTSKALKKTRVDESLHQFVLNIVRIVLWITVIISALGYMGLPIPTFVVAMSAVGAAVALALKDSLSNIAGGIILLITKPFGKDDFVDIGGTFGKVDMIDIWVTTLKTPDNKVISVPNGTVTTSIITNYSKEQLRRVDCIFRIGYDSSIDLAKETILAVAEVSPLILKSPHPEAVISSQEENSVNILCKAWCNSADYWDVKYFLEENVKLAFDEAGISIPYPQIDVHIVK